VKLKKHFLFSAMYIQYEGQEMVLVILDDVTAIEKQRVELANKQKRIDEDLVSAAGIQRSLLPPSFPVVENVRFASRFLPCERVGGDIFNVFALNEDKTAMYILDVSGHGVPAALVTVSVSQMLNPVTGYFCTPDGRKPSSESGLDSPKTVLETLDKDYPIERFDKYFSMCYAVLDHRLGLLRYSNAGHPAPILLRRDGSIETLNRGGTIIGLGGLMQFEEEVKALEPGDRVFFYTDGITEYFSDTGEAFGADRMRRTLRELRGAPLRTMLDGLVAAATSFGAGSRADDDITLLVMEYR
jgi:sigma-B regulation protein RsbU (phosphoserine phosphatase)